MLRYGWSEMFGWPCEVVTHTDGGDGGGGWGVVVTETQVRLVGHTAIGASR